MKKTAAVILAAFCLIAALAACGAQPAATAPVSTPPVTAAQTEETQAPAYKAEETPEPDRPAEEEIQQMLCLKIGETAVSVDWEENESVEALRALCREAPLTVSLSMYGGFEQVGPIGTSLPRSDVQTTPEAGDIVLYAGNQIVVFYGSNSWAYTRLGHIADKSADDLASLLGQGDVSLTLWLEDAR